MIQFLSERKLFVVAILLIVAGIAVFFFFRKEANDRSLGGSDQVAESDENQSPTPSGEESSATEEIIDENGEKTVVKKEDLDANKLQSTNEDVYANITTEHCNTDCTAFANRLDYFEYCQQVCGLAPIKEVSKCEDEKDLERDYCLKDLAVTKKDSSICNQISDENIKKTCKSRILEEILEEQHSQ